MKTFSMVVLYFGLSVVGVYAQPANGTVSQTGTAAMPACVDSGPNHSVWQWQTYEVLLNGQTVAHTHQYTELASGLNYSNTNGQWTPSQEKIEAFSGGAIAQFGQHKVIFANNLNSSGAVDMQAADGKRMRSNIVGLMYSDPASGQSTLIAQLQDSEGELISDNQVLYTNAFEGVKANVMLTYRRDGLEQDVILMEQPPAPEAFGMNSATAELEVVTEFIDSPTSVADAGSDSQTEDVDQTISWGATSLGRGKAFSLNGVDSPASVYKRFITINGRHFLLERVKVRDIQKALSNLPEQASNTRKMPSMASKIPRLPKVPTAKSAARPVKLAVGPLQKNGYVLDYITLSPAYTNFTFQGDTTYYVSGSLNLSGTNYFEGNTVIKYATNACINGVTGSRMIFLSAPYRPVVFTAKDDNAIAESITGSSGNPSGYYANPALNLASMGSLALSDFRIAYANHGLSASGASPAIYDAQFVNCAVAISDLNGAASLENVLLSNIKTNFNTTAKTNTIFVQNATFNNAFDLINGSFTNTWLYLTNCVFVNATNLSGNISAGYNGFYRSPTVGSSSVTNTLYPLQRAGAANCYLTNGCAFQNAGTTNIDPYALWLIGAKTTYAPVIYSNITFLTVTNLSPQAQRDDIGNPSPGYHYDPLDYVFGNSFAKSNLTFGAGTAVGSFFTPGGGLYGLAMGDSATVSFNGIVNSAFRFSRYSMVQEGGNGNWTAQSSLGGITGLAYTHAAPGLSAKFTIFTVPPGETGALRDDANNDLFIAACTDCEFYGAQGGGYNTAINSTNCLYVNSGAGMWDNYGAATLYLSGCTFFRGGINSHSTTGQSSWPVSIINCAFDSTTFSMSSGGGSTNGYHTDYNSFLLNSNRTLYAGAHDLTITNGYMWQSSWLGNFYLPPNSPLIDKGSTNANLLGLYQFTTQTNQMKETNSIVDIGYHYVATDIYGNPLDSNGDGIPDYLQDTNGDGLVDNGESPWMPPPAILTQPASQSIALSSNASFTVLAVSLTPMGCQWYLYGSNLLVGATSFSLSITNVQTTNAGNYSVVITNAAGSTTSSVATLTVLVGPVITIQPTNITAIQGSTVAFTVSATGSTPLNYQWQFNGTNLGGVITTIAGSTNAGYSGDGGAATNAGLNNPFAAAVDGVGNLYIADSYDNVIRKVSTNGVITTVAGNGTEAYSGDGGTATNASLSGPLGVALDRAGNLYIADSYNNVIRKIGTNGIISTVVGNGSADYLGDGGAAPSASLNVPFAVVVDGAGNLYIADSYNDVIRKVGTNGIINTIVGTNGAGYSGDGGAATNASLNQPRSIALDARGNLLVADTLNGVVRNVGTNGIITTVAGVGSMGYSGDGGAATNAYLNGPSGIVLDAHGNLLIADTANEVIRNVDTNGFITTVVGVGAAGYTGDGGVATRGSL